MPIKMSWLRKALYFLIMFAGASLIANAWITRDHVTGVAPTLPAQFLYRQSQQISYPQDAPTLVYFYASWCPICKADLPAVESIAEHYPVIVVAMQSGNDAEVRAHRAQKEIDLNLINDEQGALAQAFRVRGVPTAFVIDQNENIRFSTQGFSGWIGYWARMLWADWFY